MAIAQCGRVSTNKGPRWTLQMRLFAWDANNNNLSVLSGIIGIPICLSLYCSTRASINYQFLSILSKILRRSGAEQEVEFPILWSNGTYINIFNIFYFSQKSNGKITDPVIQRNVIMFQSSRSFGPVYHQVYPRWFIEWSNEMK